MNRGSLAADAVSVRRLRTRGVSESILRRQLAAVAVPATRRFVFVRRVVLRAEPDQVKRAMTTALDQLAARSDDEEITYADFPALAVACARTALSGGLGSGPGGGWHWRVIGVERTARPGEAVAALLSAYPLEAGAAVAALAEANLLAPIWRDIPEFAASRLIQALGDAAQFSPPKWPSVELRAADEEEAPIEERERFLSRAALFWTQALSGLPRRHEAIRAAAVLSLLRWSPLSLRAPSGPLWPHLLARLVDPQPAPTETTPKLRLDEDRVRGEALREEDFRGIEPAARAQTHRSDRATEPAAPPAAFPASPEMPAPTAISTPAAFQAPLAVSAPSAPAPAIAPLTERFEAPQDNRPHGKIVSTRWGGVLFLINSLNRLDIAQRLAECGPASPTGWRLLLDLGLSFGMPEEEPLAEFLAAQDLGPTPPQGFIERLRSDIEALYAPDDVWPLPLAEPARLLANETHLDLDLMTTRVNVDIRRVGLDIDPGWVAWLGRIVMFHYPNLSAVHLGGG